VNLTIPAPEGQRPFFKLPDAGNFEFRLGRAAGVIHVIEYTANAYQEVGAREADKLLANIHPLVLDVRTRGEFAQGHIEGAALIPVQELQARLGELAPYRDQTVFVYCRSGNRSTVAAKMLIDAGHERVVNLRRGIKEWTGEGLPVVKTPPRDLKSRD
jgi:rhodanese-related sulfurtransferase